MDDLSKSINITVDDKESTINLVTTHSGNFGCLTKISIGGSLYISITYDRYVNFVSKGATGYTVHNLIINEIDFKIDDNFTLLLLISFFKYIESLDSYFFYFPFVQKYKYVVPSLFKDDNAPYPAMNQTTFIIYKKLPDNMQRSMCHKMNKQVSFKEIDNRSFLARSLY